MIVKMKKITLLVAESNKHILLQGLRKLGTVHIRNITTPASTEISNLQESTAQVEKAVCILSELPSRHEYRKIEWQEPEIINQTKEILSLNNEKEKITGELHRVEQELDRFKPWGDFNPQDILDFEASGIYIKLYRLQKNALKKLAEHKDINVISEDKHYIYIAHVSRDKGDLLPFEELKLPDEEFKSLCKKQESAHARVEEINASLSRKINAIDCMNRYIKLLGGRHSFLNVKYGMQQQEGFSCLQGFCPTDNTSGIKKFSSAYGCAYLIEDPGPIDDVPTLIRNPKWIDIIKPVFDFMNTTPGYGEFDISLWFLMFLSLFFAMLVGDAGYGILFVVSTFFVRRKFKKVPIAPFALMYFFSFTTIIWGVITGTWFGSVQIAKLPFLQSLVIPQISSFGNSDNNFMIYLCFIIGIIHLTIAHMIRAFRYINTLQALAEAGWILVLWAMFFAAGTLVIGRPFPGFVKYIFISGFALLVLFLDPQKNILKGILSSLANLPLKIIGSFSDIVSYLRLFAVGYASCVVASSFNDIALQLGFNNIVSSLGAAVVLFLGHALNITLGFMAVIVHGVRLNVLEFSGQMGMEWSGKRYEPFKEEKVS